MNKYIRALAVVPTGLLKTIGLKLLHFKSFKGVQLAQMSPFTEITLDGGNLEIGDGFKMRDGAKLRIRKDSVCTIGQNVSFSSNSVVVCHEKISIGDNVQLSPNVQIYDHDHDFRHPDGLRANHFKTASVIIGKNCWIGANSVILRGTVLGDNCVVGAGCVLKGTYPTGTVIVQKRTTTAISHEGKCEIP